MKRLLLFLAMLLMAGVRSNAAVVAFQDFLTNYFTTTGNKVGLRTNLMLTNVTLSGSTIISNVTTSTLSISNLTFNTFTVPGSGTNMTTYIFPLTNFVSGQFLTVITNGTNVYIVGTNLPTSTVVFDTVEELVATPIPLPGIGLLAYVRDPLRGGPLAFYPNSTDDTNRFDTYASLDGPGNWKRPPDPNVYPQHGVVTGGLVTNDTLVAALTLQSSRGTGQVKYSGQYEFLHTDDVPLLDNNALYFEDGAQATGLVLSGNGKTNVAVYGGRFIAPVADPSLAVFYLTNTVNTLIQGASYVGYSGATVVEVTTSDSKKWSFNSDGFVIDQGPKTSGDLVEFKNGGTNAMRLTAGGSIILEPNTGFSELYLSAAGESDNIDVLFDPLDPWIQITSGGDIVSRLRPLTVDGSAPYVFGSAAPHTSGSLLEVANSGTNQFSVAAVSGYTGTGTNFLSDDGTFKPGTGGGGATINPTDGFMPYRLNATTFSNSPISRISSSRIQVDGDIALNGVTASFPAIGNSGTTVILRKADNSTFADLSTGFGLINSYLSFGKVTSNFTGTGGTIPSTQTLRYIAGLTNSYTLASTPTVDAGNGSAEQWLLLVGGGNVTNVITIQDESALPGSTLELGAATRTLNYGESILLRWSSTDSKWYEMFYSGAGAGGITGSGTANVLPKFTGASAIGNSTIGDTGSAVTIGNPVTASSLVLTNDGSSILMMRDTDGTELFEVELDGTVFFIYSDWDIDAVTPQEFQIGSVIRYPSDGSTNNLAIYNTGIGPIIELRRESGSGIADIYIEASDDPIIQMQGGGLNGLRLQPNRSDGSTTFEYNTTKQHTSGNIWTLSNSNALKAAFNYAGSLTLASGAALVIGSTNVVAELSLKAPLADPVFTGSLQLPNGAAPTVDAFGEIAGDNNLWASGRGAPVFYDGTAAVALIGALVSDTPSNGQVPTWNTGGTITWETPSGSSPWTASAVTNATLPGIASANAVVGTNNVAAGYMKLIPGSGGLGADGEIWYDSGDDSLKAQVQGSTVVLTAGSNPLNGTLTAGIVPVSTGVNSLSDSTIGDDGSTVTIPDVLIGRLWHTNATDNSIRTLSGTTPTLDLTLEQDQYITLSGNTTVTLANSPAGTKRRAVYLHVLGNAARTIAFAGVTVNWLTDQHSPPPATWISYRFEWNGTEVQGACEAPMLASELPSGIDAAKIGGGGVSTTEFDFLGTVTSDVQTQINAKAPTASPTFTGTVTIPTPFTLGAVSVLPTGTELNFVDGVTSAIQTQLDAKSPSPSDTAFASSWNAVTTIPPTKNAVYDWGHLFDTDDDGKVNVLDLAAGIPKTDSSGVLSLATLGTDYLDSTYISDTAFASSWNGVTTIAATKNAVYDWGHVFDTDDDGKVDLIDSTAGTATLSAAGAINLNTTDDQIGVHNGTKEVAVPLKFHREFSFDPKAICDGTIDRLFLFTVGNWAPKGITITAWRLSFEADPTTEVDLDLKRADAFIGVANSAVMDVLDTTAGVSSESTAANINGGAVVANGKVVYLEFGTAYTEANHQMIFEIEYEHEED